jgi:hypothetical protein
MGPLFHRPELGTTRAHLENMITDDFWETGASGRRYDRKFILDILEERSRNPGSDIWGTSEFRCQELAEDIYLLTYTLLQGKRKTRRLTIWQRTGGAWKARYHQGTIATD